MSFIYSSLDDENFVVVFFLDQSRVFDCFNSNFLMDKLFNLFFRGIFFEYIESYLMDDC